jgi:predicted transposase/invertase (TIGR01784 family)
MPNFKLDLHEVRTSLDKWLYIIKHLKNMKNVPDIFKNTLFEDVLEKAAIDNLSEAEYTAYHSSLKQYRDLKNGLDFAFHNGRTEGEAIGFVKGEEIGRNEGKKEEKILIAKKMKSNGVSIQNIIEYTGLREDEINLL